MKDQPMEIEVKLPEDAATVFVKAWNERYPQKIAALFEEDAEFINVTGLWWHSRAEIEKAHSYGLNTIFKDSRLKLLKTKLKYLSEAIVVMQAKMKLSGQTPTVEVAQPGERRTIFTFVLRRENERWWIVSAQNTDIIPNMETHVRDEKGQLNAVDYRDQD